MTGSGVVTAVRVGGPRKRREAKGEDASLYWMIETTGRGNSDHRVESLSPMTYGILPEGFEQIYPEGGKAPELVEGEKYYVQIVTSGANGDSKDFIIRNGKVEMLHQ
jgi:hypothetical protein